MYFNDINEKIIHVDSGKTSALMSCSLAGITYPASEYRIVRSPSKDYIFEYVTSGKGYVETEGEIHEVKAGTFYCLRRGVDLIYYADPDDPYEKIWMYFDGEMIERLFDFFLIGNILIVKCNVFNLFLEVHDALESIPKRDPSNVYADILGLLFKILTTATKDRFFPSTLEMNALDEKIRSYIDSNVYTDLSLDKIADEFGITKMHIIRVFKNKFNITPMQYLLEKKITIAKSLLADTVMPIKEIAELLHYSNTQHFSSSFKNAVGCTPNKYRQSNQG